MRSHLLATALTEFVQEAAVRLRAEVDGGIEVPFELIARPARARRTPLYCYRPQSGAFIAERWSMLRGLPSHERAARLLEDFEGLDRYLLARGLRPGRRERPARPSIALRALLDDVFAEQDDFELRGERLAAALARIDASTSASAEQVTLVGTLHGLTLSSPELALTRGLRLARPDARTDAPEGALAPREASAGEHLGHLLVTLTLEAPDTDGAIEHAREALAELLRALRLFGDARVTLGALAWARVGAGPWSVVPLGGGGRPHGMLLVSADQEDELRAFCNLLARRAPTNDTLAWALARYELGCERADEHTALSDYLLALRALLIDPGEAQTERLANVLLAERLAALCATPERRLALSARVEQALALECAVIAGAVVERARGELLVRELAGHLRALLRDVLCGHLDRDLIGLAEELLRREELAGDGEEGAERAATSAPARESGQGARVPAAASPDAATGPAAPLWLRAHAGESSSTGELDDDPWETDQLQLAGLPG